ncbi:ankyrin [Sistotremastrum niveocremeum HHB9708]|uniref:Ankyrin n=2 Tax=Sistotremastraceae TaxID=3402574 RepID=A0A164MX26_9AGAM|nr:ankyrin [Sistotremastrum niveocremeum HHB9708]KZT32806.1 ankyrin [Sistotremastrum suecicum HHB10207 ss-3]
MSSPSPSSHPDPSSSASGSTPPPTAAATTNQDGKISTLPDETLDFAAKVFDLARKGDKDTLETYLNAGLPPNLTNSSGNTLLMLAAYSGHAPLVRLLHSKGADVDRLNDRGQSPLAGAIFKGEDEVVKTLVELGADPTKGEPNARDAVKVFGAKQYEELLGVSPSSANEEKKSE